MYTEILKEWSPQVSIKIMFLLPLPKRIKSLFFNNKLKTKQKNRNYEIKIESRHQIG